jgi:hypothetical protein
MMGKKKSPKFPTAVQLASVRADGELLAILQTLETIQGDALQGDVESDDAQIVAMVLAKAALRRVTDVPFPPVPG